MKPGKDIKIVFSSKAQVLLETLLALTMLVLFLLGAMAILKNANQ